MWYPKARAWTYCENLVLKANHQQLFLIGMVRWLSLCCCGSIRLSAWGGDSHILLARGGLTGQQPGLESKHWPPLQEGSDQAVHLHKPDHRLRTSAGWISLSGWLSGGAHSKTFLSEGSWETQNLRALKGRRTNKTLWQRAKSRAGFKCTKTHVGPIRVISETGKHNRWGTSGNHGGGKVPYSWHETLVRSLFLMYEINWYVSIRHTLHVHGYMEFKLHQINLTPEHGGKHLIHILVSSFLHPFLQTHLQCTGQQRWGVFQCWFIWWGRAGGVWASRSGGRERTHDTYWRVNDIQTKVKVETIVIIIINDD